ncbi:MAG: excinuclease ABC subunit UvrC [Candidatus Woesearchaeota archaeon]
MTKAPFSLSKLPSKPGCYFFKDISGEIIYIGKAKNLKKRVSSYFAKDVLDSKTASLVESIRDVEVLITKNEVEALLLESNLIRKHKPKYNIELKYGVRYAWVLLTDEKYPRLLTARSKKTGGEYFGPFTSGQLRRTLIETLQKKFFIRTCRKLPKKPCLRYHIEICKAPCVGYQSHEDYMRYIEAVRRYLKGDNDDLIKELESEMHDHSKKQEFEKAKECKEQIEALGFLQKRMLVENNRLEEQDVIGYKRYKDKKDHLEKVYVILFSFRNGVLQDREQFTIADERSVLDEFLKRYYEAAPLPSEIILPHELDDVSIREYLKEKAGHKVTLTAPKRGLKRELLSMVESNLNAKFSEAELLAREIQEKLGLEQPARTIECFDISHLSGTEMVGAMSYFRDGQPVKGEYRRFKIQDVDGIDDFRAMEEVVRRRYARLKKENKPFPDLILIDGGAIQVDFAVKAIEKLGLDIPLVGLAKKQEEIYFPDELVAKRFNKDSRMMRTLIQARDEAHRFGVSYHRLLRSKRQARDGRKK